VSHFESGWFSNGAAWPYAEHEACHPGNPSNASGDFQAGGAERLSHAERASTIISLERRIAALDAQIKGAADS
jgi:hypothetical protein